MGTQDESSRSSSHDRLGVVLGSIALKRKWITPDQLKEALTEQGKDFAEGKNPRPLSEILLAQKSLTPGQIRALQEEGIAEYAKSVAAGAAAAAARPEYRTLDAGSLFGKYRILKLLGRGGMAAVYEALDPQLDRRVALKILRGQPDAETGEKPQEEERFLREARLSANLPKHPNLVGVYEAGVFEGQRYIAAELVDGLPADLWKEKHRPDLRRQVALLRDVALAVHHAHEHGVVHRDLKPQNILVDERGQPHITDFGLAKALRPGRENTVLTGVGMTVGTPAYMSPEQAQASPAADHRVDVYSLGVLLYEVLADRTPFTGDTGVEIMIKAARDPLPRPSTVRRAAMLPATDPVLERICLKAMARDLRERTATAQIFALQLGQWLRGESVKIDAPARRTRPWAWGIAAGLAIGAALLIARAPWRKPLPPPVVVAPTPAVPPAPPGSEYVRTNAQGAHEYRHLKDGSIMVLIPAGEFLRGANAPVHPNEAPQHAVHVDAFLIDQTEVTVARFRRFVEATGYVTEAEQSGGAFYFRGTERVRDPRITWRTPGYAATEDHPVTCVSWKDASEYCRWAGKRLPTEAEWEKAARGTDGRVFPWGNAWETGRAAAGRTAGGPGPVGQFPGGAGPFGLLDAAGNVSEMCADWMDEKAYQTPETRNPKGPEKGTHRILKGGSWWDPGIDTRAPRRFPREERTMPSNSNGFRTARDLR